jgi:hypothetical protein
MFFVNNDEPDVFEGCPYSRACTEDNLDHAISNPARNMGLLSRSEPAVKNGHAVAE